MSTKPSSALGPTSTPPVVSNRTAAQHQKRGPRKLRDPASEGGVMLPPTPKTTPSQAPSTNPPADANTGPNRRRRPRKLNKEPSTDAATATGKKEEAVGTELEALKSRVRGLEAKVEELYKAGTGGAKSPRRRGKARKGSTPAVSAAQAAAGDDGAVEGEEEMSGVELQRLEDELAVARLDLATLSSTSARPSRPRASRVASADADDVEEIPRGSIPSAADARPRNTRTNTNSTATNNNDKAVTLTGSYRIPLPQSVNIDDVRSIQSGITSAQAVARSFLDSRRENAAAAKTAPAQPHRSSSFANTNGGGGEGSVDAAGEQGQQGGQSWGEWFGAYSMSISRAVKKIEAEAGVEVETQSRAQQPRVRGARPITGARRASAPGVAAKPTGAGAGAGAGTVARKGATTGAGAGAKAAPAKPTTAAAGGGGSVAKGAAGRRPPLKPRASNPGSGAAARGSTEQVKTAKS